LHDEIFSPFSLNVAGDDFTLDQTVSKYGRDNQVQLPDDYFLPCTSDILLVRKACEEMYDVIEEQENERPGGQKRIRIGKSEKCFVIIGQLGIGKT